MKEISEKEWGDSVSRLEQELEDFLGSDDYTFEKHFDLEIILELLKSGLKNKRDEKNKV